MDFYVALLLVYPFLVFMAIDFKNFGLRRPFLFNFNLNSAIILTQFIVLYLFVMGSPENAELGICHQLMVFYVLPLYLSLFFNRRKWGYLFILGAFALSIYSLSGIYFLIDRSNYSFLVDTTAINKVLCTTNITDMMSDIELAKMNLPETHEIRLKKFADQVFDTSSEIYLLMKKSMAWNRTFKGTTRNIVPLWHSGFTGVCGMERRDHHFYIKGGEFKDILIYCDDVTSYEVENAMKKALADYKRLHNK